MMMITWLYSFMMHDSPANAMWKCITLALLCTSTLFSELTSILLWAVMICVTKRWVWRGSHVVMQHNAACTSVILNLSHPGRGPIMLIRLKARSCFSSNTLEIVTAVWSRVFFSYDSIRCNYWNFFFANVYFCWTSELICQPAFYHCYCCLCSAFFL